MTAPFDYEPEDAFYGPVGELVKRLEKCVPMDILALYCALLVAIGTIVGRRAVISYIADQHFANLFLVMVGKTGCGKGTSWSVIEKVATQIHPGFPSLVPKDSASGPGLIHLVRDASTRITNNGKPIKDEGVTDKRRLVLFEEMETLFTSMGRSGATLDQTWRLAWAGSTLENNTRKGQERASNPHLSLIGQITPEAFQRALSQMGKQCVTSGFINRFLIVPVVRVRKIHRAVPLPDVGDLVARIRQAVDGLGSVPPKGPPIEIQWSPETFELWDAFCDAIDNEDPFLEGVRDAHGRLKPMTMRVAMLLAVIDGESFIGLPHLRAAKALCLRLVDASRDFFTGKIATRSRGFKDRLQEFQPKDSTFGLTDLQRWIKTKIPKDDQPSNAELHELIDDLLATGEWVAVRRTEQTRHRNWRFALPDACENLASAEEQPIDVLDEPEQSCTPSEEQAYYLRASFTVQHQIQGLTPEDKPVAVQRGKTGHLVQLHTGSTGPLHERLQAIQALKRHHRLVEIEGGLLLLPLKQVLAWAEAEQTTLQVA
jgi:hypothetical protein